MLNSAEAVVFPSPIEPPIRHRCAILGARCGCSRSSSAMFVSGPIGAIATGSGLSARRPRDERDGAGRVDGGRGRVQAACRRSRSRRGPRSPGRRSRAARPAAPSATGHVVRAERVEQAQRVLRAAGDVGVAADGGHGEQVAAPGWATARPIASASSRPGSLSMISGSGCSTVPTGAVRGAAPRLVEGRAGVDVARARRRSPRSRLRPPARQTGSPFGSPHQPCS